MYLAATQAGSDTSAVKNMYVRSIDTLLTPRTSRMCGEERAGKMIRRESGWGWDKLLRRGKGHGQK